MIDPSSKKLNRPFALSFHNNTDRRVHAKYYLPTVAVKDYNVMTDGQNLFDQPVKNDLRTYNNIWKTAIGPGDGYTTVCLLDNNYFNKHHKLVTIHLNKQQAINADQKKYNKIIFQEI